MKKKTSHVRDNIYNNITYTIHNIQCSEFQNEHIFYKVPGPAEQTARPKYSTSEARVFAQPLTPPPRSNQV